MLYPVGLYKAPFVTDPTVADPLDGFDDPSNYIRPNDAPSGDIATMAAIVGSDPTGDTAPARVDDAWSAGQHTIRMVDSTDALRFTDLASTHNGAGARPIMLVAPFRLTGGAGSNKYLFGFANTAGNSYKGFRFDATLAVYAMRSESSASGGAVTNSTTLTVSKKYILGCAFSGSHVYMTTYADGEGFIVRLDAAITPPSGTYTYDRCRLGRMGGAAPDALPAEYGPTVIYDNEYDLTKLQTEMLNADSLYSTV